MGDDTGDSTAPTYVSRPRIKVTFEFTLFGEDRDRDYAEALAEAMFNLLAGNDEVDLDSWDYSCDGFDVVEYHPPNNGRTEGAPDAP